MSQKDSHHPPSGQAHGWPVTHAIPCPAIDKSPRRQLSLNSAIADIDDTGRIRAKLQLLTEIHRQYEQEPQADVPFHRLDPTVMSEIAVRSLIAGNELGAVLTDAGSVHRRLAELLALVKGESSPHRASIEMAVRTTCTERFDNVAKSLQHALNACTFGLGQIAANGHRHLDSMAAPALDNEGLKRLRNLDAALIRLDLPVCEIPHDAKSTLRRALLARADEIARAALGEIVSQYFWEEFRQHARRLRTELKLAGGRAAACKQLFTDAKALLQNRLLRAQKRVESSETGLEILLPSPTAMEFLAKLVSNLEVSKSQLATQLRGHLRTRLQSRRERESKPLWEVSAAQLLGALEGIIDPLLKDFTFYRAAHRYGLSNLAQDLFDRAQALVFLERASPALNVDLLEIVVATLPQPVAPRDEQIKTLLERALQALCKGIKIDVAQREEGGLEVVRCLAGFSAALIADNATLAVAYRESKKINHLPHLFGVLNHAVGGQPSEYALKVIDRTTNGPQE